MLERDIGSVFLSASHAGNASKLMNARSRGFTKKQPRDSSFKTNFHTIGCRDCQLYNHNHGNPRLEKTQRKYASLPSF